MVQDRDFRTMLSEREAGKTRGPPSGSHFAKMQNSNVWGVKPNFMGEDKDWPMPKEIPKAKTTGDESSGVKKAEEKRTYWHTGSDGKYVDGMYGPTTQYIDELVEKDREEEESKSAKKSIKKTNKNNLVMEADEPHDGMTKPKSPLVGEGNLTKSDKTTRDKQMDAMINLSEKGFNDAEAMNMSGLGRVEAKGGHTLHADESDSTDKNGEEVGETVTSRKSAFGTEIRPFKDMMAFRKTLTIGEIMHYPGYDPDYIPTLPPAPSKGTIQTTLDDGPNSIFGQDNYIENELTRRTDLDNDVTDDDVAQERALENVARDHVERKALKDDKIEGKDESGASNKNSKYKNIDRRTERKP